MMQTESNDLLEGSYETDQQSSFAHQIITDTKLFGE